MKLQPNYIVDSHNHKIAVQIDIQTYEKITEALENHALYKFMDERKEDEKLSIKDARSYYASLKENDCVVIETVKHRKEIYKFFP